MNNNDRTTPLTLSLYTSLLTLVEQAAQEENVSRSEWVRGAIRLRLKKQGKRPTASTGKDLPDEVA